MADANRAGVCSMSPRASWILLTCLLAIILALAGLSTYLLTHREPPQDARRLVETLSVIEQERDDKTEALRVDVERRRAVIRDRSTKQATTYQQQPVELIKRLDALGREYGL